MKKNGFTMIELLIVVSIMAIVATLATGAAMKAVRQGRIKRIEATAKVLEMAIMNYRAQKGAWPFKRPSGNGSSDFEKYMDVNGTEQKGMFVIHGDASGGAGAVFAKLYKGGYLDGSGMLCTVNGTRKVLNTVAKSEASSNIQIGYPNPNESSEFDYYCIVFNANTDTVYIERQDVKSHKCPPYNTKHGTH